MNVQPKKTILNRLFRYIKLTIFVVGMIYLYAGFSYSRNCSIPRASCLDHRLAGCSISGDYDLMVSGRRFNSTCDMKSDGGGWTLIANYLRRASPGRVTPTVPMRNQLPLMGGDRVGDDESGTPHWGHASNEILQLFKFKEYRFKCRSSSHSRQLDFKLHSPNCMEYFRTGKGSCTGNNSPEKVKEFLEGVEVMAGHTANLPDSANVGWEDQTADFALLNYPFNTGWKYHWALGAQNNRWECDDMETGGSNSTFHQIWIR